MSGFNYSKLGVTALKLLTRFGTTMTLGLAGISQRTVLGVRTKVIAHELLDSQIQVGDVEYVIAAVDTTGADSAPKEGERMSLTGQKDRVIVLVVPVRPAGVTLVYRIYGRIG